MMRIATQLTTDRAELLCMTATSYTSAQHGRADALGPKKNTRGSYNGAQKNRLGSQEIFVIL